MSAAYDNAFTDLICTDPTAHRIYLAGYEAGYARGFKAADESAETIAELAARRFYAMDATEAHQRAAAKNAADWVDVHAYRAQLAEGGRK